MNFRLYFGVDKVTLELGQHRLAGNAEVTVTYSSTSGTEKLSDSVQCLRQVCTE
jgi:hypothetical protein